MNTLIRNAKIYDGSGREPLIGDILLADDRIREVGGHIDTDADRVIDLQGKSVAPGFIDGHCHFVGYGETKVRYADLNGCKSFEEVLERLAKHNENNDSENYF